MKRVKMVGGIVLAALMVLLIGACDLNFGKDEEPGPNTNASGVDYTNHERDFSIKVSNLTTKNVVAFHSRLELGRMVGGVSATTSNVGLKNDVNLFTATPQEFKLIFITEEQFTANKSNLAAIGDAYFTQVFVYWNGRAGDNQKVYEISDKLGGDYQLQIMNPSNKFDVELRVGGIAGPILGFAPKGIINTKLNVGMGDLIIFPVFKYLNTTREVVETIIPKLPNGNPWYSSYNFEGSSNDLQVFNLQQALAGVTTTTTTGAAWLIIRNDFVGGAVAFIKGTSLQRTQMGTSSWNSGTSREFVIEMPSVSSSTGSWATSVQVSNYSVTANGVETASIQTAEGATTFELQVDKSYTVYVTGQPGGLGADALKAVVEIREGESRGPVAVTIEDYGW